MNTAVLPQPTTTPNRPRPQAAPSGHRADRRHLAERLTLLAFVGDLIVVVGMLLFSYALRFHTKLKYVGLLD